MSDRRELILYATPTGPLAKSIDEYFSQVKAELRPTVAQTYPPHCTLTGFFRRDHQRADEVVAEIGEGLRTAGPVPADAVGVTRITSAEDWVGLELSSPWLMSTTQSLFHRHRLEPGDDAVRFKDWLHLSLAYGIDDLRPHGELAQQAINRQDPAGWEVALWERHPDGSWTRHHS